MRTLGELVDDLGPPILRVLTAPRGTRVELDRLVVNDPVDLAAIGPGTVVLGINVAPGRETAQLLATMGRSQAPVLVLRSSERDPKTVADAEEAGVAVLAIPPAATWTHVILLVGSVLSRGRFGTTDERLVGATAGDLFAVANAVADLLDAPVTIEDPQSRVIAFSGRQEEADAARAATVLGRAVPQDWMQELRRRGVFQQLARSREPIYAELPGVMLRAAIAIRAGDEILGSIWAALPRRLSPEREQAMTGAAGFVALHLLRHRLAWDAREGLETELMATLLEGGNLAADAARRLNLQGQGFRVLAAGLRGQPGQEAALQLARCRDLLALELSSSAGRPVAAVVGETLYAVAPLADGSKAALAGLRTRLERVAERASRIVGTDLLAGIGTHATSIEGIPGSRTGADQALRVVRAPGSARTIAEIGDVQASAILLRFAEAHADDPIINTGMLRELADHDRSHGTAYLLTLRAYLDSFGDIEKAAAHLDVHPNTVRYRIRRLMELVHVDLDNSTERLALMLQLHTIIPGERE